MEIDKIFFNLDKNLKKELNIELAIIYAKNLYKQNVITKQMYDNIKKYLKRKITVSD